MIEVYCEGLNSSYTLSGIGTYGIVLIYGEVIKELSGPISNYPTKDESEIIACIEALKAIKRHDLPVTVYSNSRYLINTVNYRCKINHDHDLWRKLKSLKKKFKKIKFVRPRESKWIERADQLARERTQDPYFVENYKSENMEVV